MAQFASSASGAGQHLTSRDHRRCDPGAQGDEQNLLKPSAGTQLELCQPSGAYVVVQDHRQANGVRNDLAQWKLLPADVRGVYGDSLPRVHDPGDHEAYRAQPRSLRQLASQPYDGVNDCCYDRVRAEVGGRWLRAVTVVDPVRIEQRGLDRGTADIDSDDKIASSGMMAAPGAHRGHVRKAEPTVTGAEVRRD
jgi:hypothetical protein